MMSLLTFSLYYTKKNCRFYFAVHLFSNKSQMMSKCGKGIMDTLAQQLVCHILVSSVICYGIDAAATWNLVAK